MADMPELAAHVRDVPVNQIREITEAAWTTPGTHATIAARARIPIRATIRAVAAAGAAAGGPFGWQSALGI